MSSSETQSRPKKNKTCSVLGCNIWQANTFEAEPRVEYYRFPARPWEAERRNTWIQFVNRTNKDGTPWIPSKHSRLCSLHFVGNKKTNVVFNPSYNPTIYNVSRVQGQNRRTKDKHQGTCETTETKMPRGATADIDNNRKDESQDVAVDTTFNTPVEVLTISNLDTPSDVPTDPRSTDTPEKANKFLENWNPENSNRETRKLTRKIYKEFVPRNAVFDNRGRLVKHCMANVCDCLEDGCPGCHVPCPSCSSTKCGHECRVNRRWMYESIAIEGKNLVIKNKYK